MTIDSSVGTAPARSGQAHGFDLGHWIGGRHVAGQGEHADIENPATSEVIGRVAQASPEEVDQAVESSREALSGWRSRPGAERGRILQRAAQLLRERNDELAHLEVLDTGKPIAEAAVVDVASGAECFEYFGGVAATIGGEHHDLGDAFFYTRREPLGVCAGIGAWNYPIQIACWKAAPALACGNTMIVKPSELTPLTTMALGDVLADAGVPPGVFTVVNGDGRVGQLLTTHPEIAKVSVTGSVGTGRRVMAAAADNLTPVTLELGGKSPLIVFEDADIDNAVSGAILGNFYTQGEVCSNGTRVFVERSIRDAFTERLVGRTEAIRIGDPLDPQTDMGALISADHRDRVLAAIRAAIAEGATPAIGGTTAPRPDLDGYFVRPTVFTDCTDDMSFVRDEIFGPVMAVLDFEDEDEVIGRANATPYGLAAGVFTSDLTRAHRVAGALDAGVCWVNSYNITPVEMPFGGRKSSGLGRENGAAAIEHYTQLKSVYVGMGDVDAPY